MSVDGTSRVKRLQEELLPRLAREGAFGHEGQTVDEIEIKTAEAGRDSWASSTLFVQVRLARSDGHHSTKRLVVKYPPLNDEFRKAMLSDEMYYNECFIYNTILPEYRQFLQEQAKLLDDEGIRHLDDDLYAKCYYAEYNEHNPVHSVLILSDLRDLGYGGSKQTSMDLNHVTKMVKLIARYHAIGLAFKTKNLEQFESFVLKLKDAKLSEDGRGDSEHFFRAGSRRAVLRRLEDGGSFIERKQLKQLDAILERAYDVAQYTARSGSLKLLCHGDYCGNNVLFKYKSDNLDQAILIDFQTPQYSSPAIDLSFFLLLNTSEDFRNEHLKHVLQSYHKSLLDTTSRILGRSALDPIVSWSDFQQDFTERAVYGYLICAFFLPVMMTVSETPYDLEFEVLDNKKRTVKEREAKVMKEGGEAATVRLVELFEECYQRGYFKHIQEHFSARKL